MLSWLMTYSSTFTNTVKEQDFHFLSFRHSLVPRSRAGCVSVLSFEGDRNFQRQDCSALGLVKSRRPTDRMRWLYNARFDMRKSRTVHKNRLRVNMLAKAFVHPNYVHVGSKQGLILIKAACLRLLLWLLRLRLLLLLPRK